MYLPKASLPAVLALVTMLSGAGEHLTGTATLGFEGTTTCDCPPTNGPFAVAVPKELAADHKCCVDTITVEYKGKSVSAILSGAFDQGKGTENIALSPMAFAMISDDPTDTTLGPVTWSFDD